LFERLSKKDWQRIVLWTVVVMFSIAIIGPAAAVESGTGVVTPGGTRDEEGEFFGGLPLPGTCGGQITQTTMTWSETGTFTGHSGSALKIYRGPTSVVLTSLVPSGTYYFGIDGSHGTDSTCSPATVGAPVTASVTVTGTSGIGTVGSCTLPGSFNRTATRTVTVTVTGSCGMKGNVPGAMGAGTAPVGTVYRWVLDTNDCVFVPCPPNNVIDSGVYAET